MDSDPYLYRVLRSLRQFARNNMGIRKAVNRLSQVGHSTGAIYLGNNRALTRTVYGQKMIVDTRDLSLAPHLLLDGAWEGWIATVFRRLVVPGMTVVDVGANVGFYSLLAAVAVGSTGRLYSFEANPQVADVLLQNMLINGLYDRSTIVPKAAYSKNGTLEFRVSDRFQGASGLWLDETYLKSLGDQLRVITVESVRLDDVIPKGTLVGVLKIDAEGAEPHVLEGASRILSESPRIKIIMELAPASMPASGISVGDLYEKLRRFGFHMFRITDTSDLQELTRQQAETSSHCDVLLQRPG